MQEIPDNIDLDAVYREYANLVYRFLYAHIHDAEWAQELMQETFLRAIDSINRYDGSCKLSTWLCQIARHIMYQELRKKNRAELVELEEYLPDQRAPDGEENVIRRERRLELYRAVHHLPEAEREVVIPHYGGSLLPGNRRDPWKERKLEQNNLLQSKTENQKGVEYA